jgi:hypothetical protein
LENVVVAVIVVKARCKKGLTWSSSEGLSSEQFDDKIVLHYLLEKSNITI